MSVDGGTPLTRVNPAPGSPAVRGVGDRRAPHSGEEKHEDPAKKNPDEDEESPVDEEPEAEDDQHLDITA